MILLVGHGYIAEAFYKEMLDRDLRYFHIRHDSPNTFGFHDFDLIINCAAFIPKPSVSLCDHHPRETIRGNLLLPIRLALTGIPLMQISTGCLYDDKAIYTEKDSPTRGFNGYCGMYVGTKLLMEEAVGEFEKHYLLRIRLPFDEFGNDRNYLSKIANYPTVYDHVNSLTHRGDFVRAALDLYEVKAPWGTYHCVNEGAIGARQIINELQAARIINKTPIFTPGPVAGCTLSIDKLKSTGVKMRHVNDAIAESIRNWKKL
jgi:dTDP-4-dehydrorhamnose reductase